MKIVRVEKIPAQSSSEAFPTVVFPEPETPMIKKPMGVMSLFSGNVYSYFNAKTGIIVAARKAGYNPEIIPMIVEKMSAKSGNQTGV